MRAISAVAARAERSRVATRAWTCTSTSSRASVETTICSSLPASSRTLEVSGSGKKSFRKQLVSRKRPAMTTVSRRAPLLGAIALQELVRGDTRRALLPETSEPAAMCGGIEASPAGAAGVTIGKDARHRLRVPGNDDLARRRKDALRLWPPLADVTDGHARHRRWINMFHRESQASHWGAWLELLTVRRLRSAERPHRRDRAERRTDRLASSGGESRLTAQRPRAYDASRTPTRKEGSPWVQRFSSSRQWSASSPRRSARC